MANAPNISTIELLETLVTKYNGVCEIRNGELIFETEEYFDQLGADNPAFDLVELCDDNCIDENDRPKYKYKEEDLTSGVRITYCRDALEKQGNKVVTIRTDDNGEETFGIYRFNYSFNVNNDSDICKYSPHLLEAKRMEIQYGGALFMNDCQSGGEFFQTLTDAWVSGDVAGAFGPFVDLFNYSGEPRFHDLVMSGDDAQYCKLLILEDNTDLKDAQVKKVESTRLRNRLIGSDRRIRCWDYQQDQWVDNLFENFHQYLDPRRRRGRLEVDKVVIPCSCELIQVLATNKTDITFRTHYGIARGERWEVCLLYTSPSPRDATLSRMPSSA